MRRGFTLLEVMVSLSILAVGLVAVVDLNAGSMRMHSYGSRVTVATLLARGKMLDVEATLKKEGLGTFDKNLDGDFRDEGWPEYTWEAKVIKPDLQLTAGDLINALSGKAGDGEGKGGMLGDLLSNLGESTGGAAGAAVMPLIQQQATKFFEDIKSSVRQVNLTVSWKDGKETETLDVSTLMVSLPDSAVQTGMPQ